MTRVYAENAEKEPAYLPQNPAMVNRQTRADPSAPLALKRRVTSRDFVQLFRAPRGGLRARRLPE